jgi:transposase-like protein
MADKPYQNADWLYEQYVEKDKSMPQIERETGVNSGTIYYWIEKHDIKTRDRIDEVKRKRRVEWANYHTNSHGHPRWKATNGDNNEDIVYVHRLLAVSEWGFDHVAGKDVHHKNGVPWDNRIDNLEPMKTGDHMSHHSSGQDNWENKDTPWRNKNKLETMYIEKKMGPPQIAEELGCGPSTIHRWLEIHDIPKRDRSEAAKLHNHHNQ